MVEIEGSNNEQLNGVFKVLGAHEGKLVIRTSGLRYGNFSGGQISFFVKHATSYHRILRIISPNSLDDRNPVQISAIFNERLASNVQVYIALSSTRN